MKNMHSSKWRISSYRLRRVTAISLALGAAFPPVYAASLTANNSTETLTADSVYSTTGSDTAGYALWAHTNGVIDSNGYKVDASTSGASANVVVAQGGGVIKLSAGSTVSATGSFSRGLSVQGTSGGLITADGVSVTTTQAYSYGVRADTGLIEFANGSVTTSGDDGTALYGYSGGEVRAENTVVNTSGVRAHGIYVSLNGMVSFTGGKIETTGDSGNGMQAASGRITVDGGAEVITHGNDAYGVRVYSAYITLDDVSVTTNGTNAHGFYSSQTGNAAAGITAASTTVSTHGDGAYGAYVRDNSWVDLRDSTINTQGIDAHGVFVEILNPVSTYARVEADNVQVTTTGDTANAVLVGKGAEFIMSNGRLETSGIDAVGIGMTGAGSKATFTRGNVITHGQDAHAVSFSAIDGTAGSLTLANASLSSPLGASIHADSALADVALTNVQAVTNNGHWLQVSTSNAAQPAVVNVTLDASQVQGAAVTQADGSVANVEMKNGSQWLLTSPSVLTSLINDQSHLQFAAPTGDATLASSYHTLTVGSYSGQDATMQMNVYLQDDQSPGDRMIVDGGTVTGTTVLSVANTGGGGAETTGNGIPLVSLINGATSTANAFSLGSRVIAGPYEYQLYQDNAGQGWYLRSEYDGSLVATPDPGPGGGGGGSKKPLYRQEVSLYTALPALGLTYGRSLLDTLHQRVGEEEQLRGRNDLNGGDIANGVWMRVIGRGGQYDGGTIYQDGPKYNYKLGAIQFGFDVLRRENTDGARDHAGLYGAVGRIDADVDHLYNRTAGSDKMDAYSLGAYWTHFGAQGWYVDSVLQGTWYRSKVESTQMPSVDVDGFGLAASVEGGYTFQLADNWTLEPQAQIIYQTLSMDDARDQAASIRFDDTDALSARLGVRAAKNWTLSSANSASPRQLSTWVRANVWGEFLAKPETALSTASGYKSFRTDQRGSWLAFDAGLTGQFSRTGSVYASAGYDYGFGDIGDAWNANVGVRFNW